MSVEMRMDGKRVVVTAGAQGIGLVIAKTFVEAGAQVHICDVNEEALDAARKSMPGVTASVTDVSNETQVDAMFAEIKARWNTLDAIINNAGIAGPTAKIEEVSLEDWQRTIGINLTGLFLCTRRAVPMLKVAGGGSIVNMSSVAGRLGYPLRTPYSASKFGVVGLTKTWAMELGPSKIRVNAVLPGAVQGERVDRVIAAKAEAANVSFEEMRDRFVANVSMRSMVTAQDVANQVLFVCSPAGAMISGQSLSVCGNFEVFN
jgi:NAD(P)-dependent dehydrogenase (short-subunit alcohol dehydrogenase family)